MKNSPWGKVQSEKIIIPGMIKVSTASHGGIKLDRKLSALMPEYLRRDGGWYEEDCEWCLPYVVLEKKIIEDCQGGPGYDHAMMILSKGEHIKTFRHWFWQECERYFSIILAPGESSCKDEDVWKEAHKNDLRVLCVDMPGYRNTVPIGMMGIIAETEAGRSLRGQERYFLIPNGTYTGGRFLVEQSYHREVENFCK